MALRHHSAHHESDTDTDADVATGIDTDIDPDVHTAAAEEEPPPAPALAADEVATAPDRPAVTHPPDDEELQSLPDPPPDARPLDEPLDARAEEPPRSGAYEPLDGEEQLDDGVAGPPAAREDEGADAGVAEPPGGRAGEVPESPDAPPTEGAVVVDPEPLDVAMPPPDEGAAREAAPDGATSGAAAAQRPAVLDARTQSAEATADAGAADAEADADAEAEADGHDGDRDEDLDAGEPAVASVATKLVTGVPAFQDRWDLIQVEFVDDPRQAVERADGLVGDVVDEIMRALATEREQLGGAWRDDSEASTEDLRLAFQRYRTMFQRLLRT